MIEDEPGAEKPIPEAEDVEVLHEPREKSPWKAFVLTGVIASLFGAAGGGYGVFEGMKRLGPNPAAQPSVDIAPLEGKVDSLTDRLSAAEASVKKAASRPAPKAQPIDLSGLESRLDELEAAPRPEIDPEALTALQSAHADGFEWPDTSGLEDRLAALEATAKTSAAPTELSSEIMERIEALEAGVQTNSEIASEDSLSAEEVSIFSERFDLLESRLAALENRPVRAPRIERVAVLAFPKDAMIEAAEEAVEGGLLKKALSKHVRVKDEDDPITLIESIEADIEQGRLEAAAETFNRLPDPVRAAGQAWYDSVKAK